MQWLADRIQWDQSAPQNRDEDWCEAQGLPALPPGSVIGDAEATACVQLPDLTITWMVLRPARPGWGA
jgi:hypothetical protein